MTTLKTYHADEIASAMSAQLGDEEFVGLYRKAEATWWQKGPASQAFKAEMDAAKTPQEAAAVHNKWLASGSEGATKLGKEHDDFSPLVDYSEDRRMKLGGQRAEDGACCPACGKEKCECQKAEDGCPKHPEARDGCPECADAAGLAVAIDFAIRHMVKVADALDKTGFVGVAGVIDETLRKLAANRPFVVRAARSYEGWVSFLKKKSPKAARRFSETYKSALKDKKKELGAKKAEEYAMRTALDGVPKSYLKEPTPKHGKGKSGPPVAKKAADALHPSFPQLSNEVAGMWVGLPEPMKEQVLPNWKELSKENLAYQLSSAEVQKRLKGRYEQWNQMLTGGAGKTPAPQAGKRSRYYSGKLVGQIQGFLNKAGIPVKVDSVWGPNTAKAWNQFLDKAKLETYNRADARGANPPIEDMKLVLNYADRFLSELREPTAKPAAKPAAPAKFEPKVPEWAK